MGMMEMRKVVRLGQETDPNQQVTVVGAWILFNVEYNQQQTNFNVEVRESRSTDTSDNCVNRMMVVGGTVKSQKLPYTHLRINKQHYIDLSEFTSSPMASVLIKTDPEIQETQMRGRGKDTFEFKIPKYHADTMEFVDQQLW